MPIQEALLSLQGLSVGDAFGTSLFFPEALDLIQRRELPKGPWMWTGETHMALSIVDELRERGSIDQNSLARRMARDYLADPLRGYGSVTRQTLERIASGEYFRIAARSAGDGGSSGCSASPRAAPVGGFFAGDPARASSEARLTAGVTHQHPGGVAGAEAVAAAAALAAGESPAGADFLLEVIEYVQEGEVRQGIARAAGIPTGALHLAVQELGVGQKYSAQDTVPFALWCAAHHLESLEDALWQAVSGMGKRDSICAIVGGIVALSARCIPDEWLARREPLPGSYTYRARPGSGLTGPLVRPAPMPTGSAHPAYAGERQHGGAGGETPPAARVQSGIREDILTGLPNLLELLDWAKDSGVQNPASPFSLVAIQLTALWKINRARGRTAGDELLKWCARILEGQSAGPVFRAGGDKFALLLQNPGFDRNLAAARELEKRFNFAEKDPPLPAPRVAAIHFSGDDRVSPGYILACLFMSLADRHFKGPGAGPVEFYAADLRTHEEYPWMMVDLADQMLRLGSTADETLRQAQTDSVSQLPNMRAAISALETAVSNARRKKDALAVLLIDGDNLRQFNLRGYEAGDEAIRLLGSTIQGQLRDGDFLARWRVGDEFLVLLPDTHLEQALAVGQRLCQAVERASTAWLFPTSISAGVAVCPLHGQTVEELIDWAESALKAAKEQGKNRIVVLPPENP